VYDGNVEAIAVTYIYKVSLSVRFVFECQTTRPLTVVTGQVVAEINLSLLFTDEVDDGQHALLRLKDKEKLHI
jgi:hypothetical protein